ncbi:ABC1 kinase family protein [Anatilimnocola sp. NA78]|uniref:ABC1 kinase family protein n=1 Tax=Anatilimnocola sp. NA78 TaxID=3415683 RepID=UPI003CE54B31
MRLTSIPQIYRNVRRGTEIISVLSKYGLADWLSRTNIDFAKDRLLDRDGSAIARFTREARIRLTLTELGPTFIKLGQLLSTRPDLVGKELANELQLLQSSTPADPPETVRAIVETELGQPIEELFAEFDLVPIASASIGQVHQARLLTGERVVVKVQHAGIEQVVNEDLEVLAGLAQVAESVAEFKPYRPVANVAEMGRTLRRELDFGREERNLQQFATLFCDDDTVFVPRAFTDLCTQRVLTMDMVDGIPLSQTGVIETAGIDREEVARRGGQLYLQMIFTHGFYHADPHPGNILLLPGNVIALIDFGMVGRIDERLREDIEEMLLAIVNHDVPMLTRLIKRIGAVPPNLDEAGLSNDVADFVGHYSTQALDQFDLSGALTDMVEIIRRYQITLPTQVAMLIKVLVTLEGTTKLLSAKFSLMELMQPMQKKMLFRRLSPARQARKFRRLIVELEQLAEVLPQRVMQILEQVQTGKFDVHLDHRGLGPSVNRLVLGMLASALFMGSSLMMSHHVPPILPRIPFISNWLGLDNVSILGLSGCTISLLVGLRLLRAIGKSGHLDQKVSK